MPHQSRHAPSLRSWRPHSPPGLKEQQRRIIAVDRLARRAGVRLDDPFRFPRISGRLDIVDNCAVMTLTEVPSDAAPYLDFDYVTWGTYCRRP
jgi:hypothetical protein